MNRKTWEQIKRDAAERQWRRRMEYLFDALPFEIRHQWGGDAREMVEGIDAALAALDTE